MFSIEREQSIPFISKRNILEKPEMTPEIVIDIHLNM